MRLSFRTRRARLAPIALRFSLALLLTVVAHFATSKANAASCCGGGFASPSVITGDEAATASIEYSMANVATEVSSSGIWQTRSNPESLETFKIQGAHVFLDRFQVGGSLPIVRRSRSESSSTGLGDLALNLGYETLPEWEYSSWRPRGVSYITLTAPTGRPIQEASDALQLDARGRGFWALGIGTTLTKILGKFDVVTVLEAHKSFAREIRNSQMTGEFVPGYGGTWSFGFGYGFKDTRIGAGLAFNYEDAIETRGQISSTGSPTRFATASLTASHMFNDEWALALGLSDQTLFGAPINTSLSRSVSLTMQRRFSR